MGTEGKTYRSFEDLDVYKAAREFRKKMYGVARRLPEIEKYGLAGQIRRAAVTVTNHQPPTTNHQLRVSILMKQFHHLGLPTDEKQAGETYVAATKVWVTDPLKHKYRVEFLRFEPDSPVQGVVRDLPHFAFRVDSIKDATAGEKVVLGPFQALPGLTVVFVEKDGAVFEFMEFTNQPDAASWGR